MLGFVEHSTEGERRFSPLHQICGKVELSDHHREPGEREKKAGKDIEWKIDSNKLFVRLGG